MAISDDSIPPMTQPVVSQPAPAPKLSFPKTTPRAVVEQAKDETLFSWAIDSFKEGFKLMPKMAKTLAIQLGVVLAINLIFWPLKTASLPGPLAKLAALIIFLTATYNNVIPKTIYWVIVFTFGKKLFFKIRSQGLAAALKPIQGVVPEFQKAYAVLAEKSLALLLVGGGIGLIIANNFASYSRFPQARNKMDKYFVALVICFAVSYILGESKKSWLFKFGRLVSSDMGRLLKKNFTCTDNHTFLILSGFVAGLLLDAPLILLKLMYGGYILGVLLAAGGIGLAITNARKR